MANHLETEIESYKIITLAGTDPALEPFKNLILASYMKSLRFGNDWFKDIQSECFYKYYGLYIDRLLRISGTIVKLALLSDDLDICLGWSMSQDDILHYIFVKGDIEARRKGIGKKLLPDKVNTITHLTKIGRTIWKSKLPDVIFNPFI